MISKLALEKSLTGDKAALNLMDVDLTSENRIKVFIPTIMSNTLKKYKKPVEYPIRTKGSRVFKNQSHKPKTTKNVIKAQNYLIASMAHNASILNTKKAIEEVTKYFADSNHKKKTVSYKIKKESVVTVKFLDGKVSKLAYTVSGITNPSISLKSIKKKIKKNDTFDNDELVNGKLELKSKKKKSSKSTKPESSNPKSNVDKNDVVSTKITYNTTTENVKIGTDQDVLPIVVEQPDV